MKPKNIPLHSAAFVTLLLFAHFGCLPTYAADADLRLLSCAIEPLTLAPGAHPTKFSYEIRNYGPYSIGSSSTRGHLLVEIYLSSNQVFGDGDDIPIGTYDWAEWFPAGTITEGWTRPVNGFTAFTVPMNASGQYRVFVRVTPVDSGSSLTPRTDPDLSDNWAMMSLPIVVSSTPMAPAIATQPQSQTVTSGTSVTFSVAAYGSTPLSYQWQKNGTAITGATDSTLTLNNVTEASAGSYAVVVSNSVGSVTSDSATLIVNPSAVAPTITTQPQSVTVNLGGTAALNVIASGTPPLSYQWRKDGTPIAGATTEQLILNNTTTANAGSYSVVVTNAKGTATSAVAVLGVVSGQSSRLANLSVRTNLGSSQTLTVGFVTSGAKQLLTRAVGPSLKTVFGLDEFYADPKLALMTQAGATLAQNDNWNASLSATCTALGAFPMDLGSRDAALLQSISGPNTVQVNGSGFGILLVEVYDAESTSSGRLTNVSARNQVGTGANILIAGFVIDGTASKTVLIRGIGPALRDIWGVPGALTDPKLEIFRQDGTKVTENDNWSASLVSTFDQVGAYRFTSGSKDAALLITLPPGVYTAQVSGVGGTTGDGVVEVYEVGP